MLHTAAREAAARVRVEELEAEIAELTTRLEDKREALSRLRITRETVAEVITEWSGQAPAETVISQQEMVEPEVRVVGAIMVPHRREGLTADVLPDMYRDIGEVVADAAGPMQAKQIVPRIGLQAVTGKIEGTRGKLKRLVERGRLVEDQPGRFRAAHPGPGGESVNSRNDKGSSLQLRREYADRDTGTTRFLRVSLRSPAHATPIDPSTHRPLLSAPAPQRLSSTRRVARASRAAGRRDSGAGPERSSHQSLSLRRTSASSRCPPNSTYSAKSSASRR